MKLSMEQVKIFKEGISHPGKYIYDLFDTIESQQQEIEQLKKQRDIWKNEFFKDSADYNEMYRKLLIERDRLLQNVEQHIKWNEMHTIARIELYNKIEQLKVQAIVLKDTLEFARTTLIFIIYSDVVSVRASLKIKKALGFIDKAIGGGRNV